MPSPKSRRKTRIPEKFPCGCVCIYRNPKTKNRTYGAGMAMTLADGKKVCRCGKVWEIIWKEASR
jgi:hypothetical protein